MKVTNDELLTPRELRRDFTRHLDRLDGGDVSKLVLMRGTDMAYVLLPIKTYEKMEGESDGKRDPRDPGQEQSGP